MLSPQKRKRSPDLSEPPGSSGKTTRSCAECRRLKIRCDRVFPCQSCIKRGCGILCPDRSSSLSDRLEEREMLLDTIRQLQEAGDRPIPPTPQSAVPRSWTSLPEPSSDTSPRGQSGTLAMSRNGRSKYIGPSAGSMWLREGAYAPPEPAISSTGAEGSTRPIAEAACVACSLQAFPFADQGTNTLASYDSMVEQLPIEEEMNILVSCFYRHAAWNGTVILREDFDEVERLVSERARHGPISTGPRDSDLDFHRLALVFIVLAYGTLMDAEKPAHHPKALEYCRLAQQCLAAGRFFFVHTITSLQALGVMAKFLTYSSLEGGRDLAWQLLGWLARMMQATGLHRDGTRWQLDARELDQRRRIFWDIYATDIGQSLGWGRPAALNPRHFDTQIPADYENPTGEPALQGFNIKRCESSVLYHQVLEHALSADFPPYENAAKLWHRILEFEDTFPFRLRCRASMRANITRYPSPAEADAASPSPRSDDSRLLFQQHALAMGCCTSIFSLIRPFFIAALSLNPEDPSKTPYGEAFLMMVERCGMVVSILECLADLSPVISPRQWFFWAHGFSAGVCLATMGIASPANPLVPLVLNRLNALVLVLGRVNEKLASPSGTPARNLQCLLALQSRANESHKAVLEGRIDSIPRLQPQSDMGLVRAAYSSLEQGVDPSALIGWQTRLVDMNDSQAPGPPSQSTSSVGAGTSATLPSFPTDALSGSADTEQHLLNALVDPTVDWGSSDALSQLLDLPSMDWLFPVPPTQREISNMLE